MPLGKQAATGLQGLATEQTDAVADPNPQTTPTPEIPKIPSPEALKFQGDVRETVQVLQPLGEWLNSWMVEPPKDPTQSRKVRIEGGVNGPFDLEIPEGVSDTEAQGFLEKNREALGLPPVELGTTRQAWNKGAKSFSEFTGAVADFVKEGTYNALGQAMGATPEEAAPGYQAMQEDQARRNLVREGNYPIDPKKDTYQGVGSLVSPSYMIPKTAGLLGGFAPALGLSLIPGVGLPVSMAAMGADGYQARYDYAIDVEKLPEDIARKKATVSGVVNMALGVSQLGIAHLGGVVAKVVPKGLGEIPLAGRLATGTAAAVENVGYNNVAMITEKTLNGEEITGTDYREASLSGILLGGPLGFAHGYHPPVGYEANKAAIKAYVKENARIFRENTDPSRSQELVDLAKLPDVTDWESAARAYNNATDKMAYARDLPDGDPLKASIENHFKLVVSLIDNAGREQGWKGEALREWTVEQRDVEEAVVVEDALGAVAADVPVETAVRKVSLDTRVRTFVEEEAQANPEAYAGLDAGEVKKAKASRKADLKARAQKKGIGTLSDEEVLTNLAAERTLADHMAQFGDGVDVTKSVGEVQESQAALVAAKDLVAEESLAPEVKAPIERMTAKQILEAKRASEAPLTPEEQALVDSTDLSGLDSLMAELDDTPRGAVEVEAPQPVGGRLRPQEAPTEPQDAPGAIPAPQVDPRVIEAVTALLEPHTAEVRMNGETLPKVSLTPKPDRQRPTTKKDTIPSLRKRLDNAAIRVREDRKDPTKRTPERIKEREDTLFGLLTSIQEERPGTGLAEQGLKAAVTKLRAEFGDTRLLQEVEPLEQATVRKPRPEDKTKADDQQEGVFRDTLRKANINPDHLPKGIVKQVLDGKLTWSHGAALLFERTGMGRVEWSTSKEGAPVATLVPHKLEGKSWETSVSVANKLWTRLNRAVQEAAVKAIGEENLQRSMTEAEVLSASRATFETRYKASNLKGGWVWDFKGKARAAFAEAGRGAHLSETQLDHVAQMSFQFAEAWASLRPGKTSRDWYETRFDPRVIKGNMTRATGTQERVGGSPLQGARTLKGGETQVGGFVEWMEGTRAIISLSKTADASTLFHEMTHVWQRDIPAEHLKTIMRWINTDAKVQEWVKEKGFNVEGALVKILPDGTSSWSPAASEAFTKMVEDIHSNPHLQSKLVPEAIRPAFEAMRGWLMRVFAGVNRGVAFLPSRAVREAYWDMFVPKGKATGSGKFAEARVRVKSGRLGVNPSYVTLSEPKAMQAWFDNAALTTKHQWPNQDELTKIARDIREGNPAEREAALKRQEAHMALPVDLTIAVQESAAASQAWFEKLSNAKTQAERMRIAAEAPNAKEVQVTQRMRDLKSTAGRALAASGNMTDFMTALNGARMLERSMTVNEVNRLAQAVDLMKAGHVGEATERLLEIHHSYKGFSHIQDIIIQIGYNARLSRPTTHAKNILSNTLWLGWQGAVHTPVTAAGSALMGVLTGKQREVFFQEIIPMLTAGWVHPQKALLAARHILRTGETPLEIAHLDRGGKLEEIKSRGMNALENSDYAWANKAAPWISVPTRYLRAADLFFQIVAFDNFMAASDAKRAQIEGRYGAEAAAPYSVERMRVEAAKFARYATFTDAPGGMTRAVIQFKNHIPIAGFFAVPFVNTLANTMKRGLEHTPGVGFLAEKVNRMNNEKTRGEMYLPEAKEWHGVPVSLDIVAKQVEGLLLGFGLLALFGGDDDRLVGARPTDPKEAKSFDASGKLENSIRVGDRWIQFGNFEPFGLALSAAANTFDRLKSYQRDTRIHAQGGNASPSAAREFIKLGDDLRTLLVNNSWASNLGGITSRRAQWEERMVKDYAKAIGFSLSSLVPYSGFLSFLGQQIEAEQNSGRAIAPETSSALVEMGYQVLPIAATVFERSQRLDVWGEPVEMKGKDLWAQWLPVKAAKANGDPVERELAKLVDLGAGYYPALPAKKLSLKLNGPMVEVPPDLYTQYAVDFGRRSKAAVAELMASQRYQALPDDWKGAMKRTQLIDDKVTKVRDSANHRVKAEMRKLGLGKAESGMPMR